MGDAQHSTPAGWYPNPKQGNAEYWWDGANWGNMRPGWYRDPKLPDQQRYHDGNDWTANTRSETGYKSSAVAGLLQLFLGWFGVGRFYVGSTGIAITQLVLGVIGIMTSWLFVGFFILVPLSIWVVIDGIIMFAGGVRDADGRRLR